MKTPRTSRRLISALAAAAVGLVGTLVVASPAQAHNAYIVADPYCDGELAKVDFTILSKFHSDSNRVKIVNIGGDFTAAQLGIDTSALIPVPAVNSLTVVKEINGVTLPGSAGDTLDISVTLEWWHEENGTLTKKSGMNPTNSTEVEVPDCDVPETAGFTPTCDTIDVSFHSDVAKVFVLRDKDGNLIETSNTAVKDFSVTDVPSSKAPLKAYYVAGSDEVLIEEYTYVPPQYCGEPGGTIDSTCDGLTVSLTNPQDGKAQEASLTITPSVGNPVTLKALRGETATHTFPGTAGLTISFTPLGGGDKQTVAWDPAEECTPTTPGLPDTGTGGLTEIILAGAALVLAGAGLLTVLFLRRRRATAQS